MNIAPDEKDKFGYRIAKPNPASQGAQSDNQRTLGNIPLFGSGAIFSKICLVRIVEDSKISAYFRAG